MILEPLPISHSLLESFRLSARRQKRPGLVGGHQMRRKGQSLEFYDYRPYQPGDDIRHVDWRASARHGGTNDLLVRTYVAEEQLTLIISLDTRESMFLPQAMPKAQIAAWLAEAVSWISLRSSDRIILHRLFGAPPGSLEVLYGSSGLNNIRTVLQRFLHHPCTSETPNLAILQPHLKPAVVWMIISDFYFPLASETLTDTGGLPRQIAAAQEGLRWVICCDTNSWPYERFFLGSGSRKIEGPGLSSPDYPLEIDTPTLQEVETRMTQHKTSLRQQIGRGAMDFITWTWPDHDPLQPPLFFEEQFGNDRVLSRLFMKENP